MKLSTHICVALVAFAAVSCYAYDYSKYENLKKDTRPFNNFGQDMAYVKQYPEEWPLLGPYGVYDETATNSDQYKFVMIPHPDSLFWFQFCEFNHTPESFLEGPVKLATASFFFWFFFYRALKLFLPIIFSGFFKGMSEHKTDLVCVKAVSIAHSVVAAILGWWCINDEALLNNYLCGHSVLAEVSLCTVIGYMIFDGMKVYQSSGITGWPTMTIHHVNIIPVFFIGLYYRVGLRWVSAFVINEASSPFLQISWFLLKFGNPKGKLFILNNIVAFLAFMGFRGVYNAVIVWKQIGAMMVYPYIPLVYVLFSHGIVHLLVNWYWCSLFLSQIYLLAVGKSPFSAKLADKHMAGKQKKEE